MKLFLEVVTLESPEIGGKEPAMQRVGNGASQADGKANTRAKDEERLGI
jgi:hypothetical protein